MINFLLGKLLIPFQPRKINEMFDDVDDHLKERSDQTEKHVCVCVF